MTVTIGDVARHAGVARSTVSYVLSGNRPISEETRRRIEEAIRDLNFTPNAGARALKTAQTKVLGVFLQFHEDEFAPAMLQYLLAITSTARTYGYDILMVTDPSGEPALRRVTSSTMVDGVVLLDVTHSDARLNALREAKQPGVLIGLPGSPEGLDVFDLDFAESARVVIDHLWGLGHREIAVISPPLHVFERGGAYGWRFRDAAMERALGYGMRVSSHYGESQQPAVNRSLNAVLDARPDATALVVHNDASIAALPSVLRDRAVSVPEDMSVVSLYARDFARQFTLPYTAIDSAPDVLGQRAVTQLLRRIQNPQQAGSPAVHLIPPGLTVRGSTR